MPDAPVFWVEARKDRGHLDPKRFADLRTDAGEGDAQTGRSWRADDRPGNWVWGVAVDVFNLDIRKQFDTRMAAEIHDAINSDLSSALPSVRPQNPADTLTEVTNCHDDA
jgi:hypothetical protein